MIAENTKKLESVFLTGTYYYDSNKTAEMFAKNLYDVGASKIINVNVETDTEYPEDIMIVIVTDDAERKYYTTLNAHTGFVSVIYENDLNGKALYFNTDD